MPRCHYFKDQAHVKSICLGRGLSKQKNIVKTFGNYRKIVVHVMLCEYGIPSVFFRAVFEDKLVKHYLKFT